MYGRTWTLSNSGSNDIGAPARGAGAKGKYTGEAGFMAYYEVGLEGQILVGRSSK
jgi:chitinase